MSAYADNERGNQLGPSKLSAPSPAATVRRSGADAPSGATATAASHSHGADIAKARMLARRQALLSGAILPTMLKLAIPTVVVLVVQTLVGVAETYFVSFLGTDALAGVALVFPVLMLMQMMSNGGVGGGVASAVARAVGAGRHAHAEALGWH